MIPLNTQEFAIVPAPTTQWLVLRCAPGRTMALAAALADRGAWTPTWTRRRRLPRSPMTKPVKEACIPSFVFLPSGEGHNLPPVPLIQYRLMHFEGMLVRIADHQLEPLRRIADKPLLPAHKLPKAGQRLRFNSGPFQGLIAKVIRCTQRFATVSVEGFAQPLQVPPAFLGER